MVVGAAGEAGWVGGRKAEVNMGRGGELVAPTRGDAAADHGKGEEILSVGGVGEGSPDKADSRRVGRTDWRQV